MIGHGPPFRDIWDLKYGEAGKGWLGLLPYICICIKSLIKPYMKK